MRVFYCVHVVQSLETFFNTSFFLFFILAQIIIFHQFKNLLYIGILYANLVIYQVSMISAKLIFRFNSSNILNFRKLKNALFSDCIPVLFFSSIWESNGHQGSSCQGHGTFWKLFEILIPP